jgi:hypothetical protein
LPSLLRSTFGQIIKKEAAETTIQKAAVAFSFFRFFLGAAEEVAKAVVPDGAAASAAVAADFRAVAEREDDGKKYLPSRYHKMRHQYILICAIKVFYI